MLALLIALTIVVMAIYEIPSQSDWPRVQPITCVNNLKQIDLAFRTWSLDHIDHLPFNVSTNDGGTMELCAQGSDGFDNNTVCHFQIISNELLNPRILICPIDRSTKPARDFRTLRNENVSYRLRSASSQSNIQSLEILVKCPFHGNTLRRDGIVTEVAKQSEQMKPTLLDLLIFHTRFRARAIEATVLGLLGCVLLAYGIKRR